ncbi:MAG: PKD domain-containing protein [Candidatus Atribacteria bacterium]|nr:PKD domain-containing protein [Candidatus Atribacteria bacterium]
MQSKPKKNLYKIIFLVIVLSFTISLTGCDWFSNGLFNIFDPQAIIKVDYTLVDLTEGAGSISLEIHSLNGVGFNASGFSYDYYYYSGIIKIPIFTKVVEANFFVEPSSSPGSPGPITSIDNLPLYFQDLIDWLTLNPLVTEVICDLNLIGKDTSNHSQIIPVASNLPVLQPGIDLYPPTAVIIVAPSSSGYAPFTVAFDASGSFDIGSGIVSYGWDFGDGNTGTGDLISHTYVNSGTYVAKLTVTDLYGNSGTANIVIIVSEVGGPTADIQLTPGATGAAPFTVAFDASGSIVSEECDSSCSIVNYNWSFGDGSTATGIITIHTYDTVGLYPVILTVTDSNGKEGYATEVITVTEEGIEPGPVVDNIIVSANPQNNVAGGTSTITAIVTDTDGQFVADGTTVYFITNNGNLSASSADTTNGMATVDLTLDASMQVGETATVTAFIGAVSGSIGVTCTFEPGASVGNIIVNANPESTVAGGTSIITAIVTDTDGQFIADGTTVYFITNNGNLSASSADTTNGMAIVTLTLSNMQVGDTATVTAFIGAVTNSVEVTCREENIPIAIINTVPSPAEGIAPFEVYFDAYGSSAEADIASYDWDFGDGNTGTGVTAENTYADAGIYIVYLTITDDNGNKGYDTVTVTVNEVGAPTAVINTVPSPAEGIVPFEVYFDAHASSTEVGNITDYDWDFGDGNTGTGVTAENTYAEVGTYTAVLTVTDSNGKKGYDSVEIKVEKAPKAVINTTPAAVSGTVTGVPPFKVYFDAYESTSESGIVSYEWNFGDGSSDTGITTNHTYNSVGSYIVYLTITDSNGYEAYDSVNVNTGSEAEVIVTANPSTISPGSSSIITATCTDHSGNTVPDGTIVSFAITGDTTGATLVVISGTTTNGVATATLTMTSVGVVTVGAATIYASGSVIVTCEL